MESVSYLYSTRQHSIYRACVSACPVSRHNLYIRMPAEPFLKRFAIPAFQHLYNFMRLQVAYQRPIFLTFAVCPVIYADFLPGFALYVSPAAFSILSSVSPDTLIP